MTQTQTHTHADDHCDADDQPGQRYLRQRRCPRGRRRPRGRRFRNRDERSDEHDPGHSDDADAGLTGTSVAGASRRYVHPGQACRDEAVGPQGS